MAHIGYNFGLVRFYWISNVVQLLSTGLALLILLPRVGVLAGAIAYMVSSILGGCTIGYLVWSRLKANPSAPPAPSLTA
jgi:hypothetical protein